MLALPLVTAALGTLGTVITLVVVYALAIYSSLLMLEVNLRSGVGDNLHVITGKILGKPGQLIQGLAFLSLLYAIIVVYQLGGSSLLIARFEKLNIELSEFSAIAIFTLGFGSFIAFGVAAVDKASRLLFSALVGLFFVVVFSLIPEVKFINISSIKPMDTKEIPSFDFFLIAIPTVFSSFSAHMCIASVVRYLKGDTKTLKKVLITGISIPLLCYILWLMVTIGSIGAQNVLSFGGDLPAMVEALQLVAGNSVLEEAIDLFANFALITSFLGTSMSLFDYLMELTRSKRTVKGRGFIWILTFVPPFFISLINPSGFMLVLGLASIPLVVMILLLPALMAYKQRKLNLGGYQVSGGTPALVISAILGVLIIVAQICIS